MHVKHARSGLLITACGFALASTGVIAWTLIIPCAVDIDNPKDRSASPATLASPTPGASTTLPTVAELNAVAKRPWQRPLYDPKPVVAPPPPPKPVPPFTAKLTATIIEPGRSVAIFVTREGETAFCTVGQQIAEAEVVAVKQNAAELKYHGKPLHLTVKDGGAR